jgi:hypothetical protein
LDKQKLGTETGRISLEHPPETIIPAHPPVASEKAVFPHIIVLDDLRISAFV